MYGELALKLTLEKYDSKFSDCHPKRKKIYFILEYKYRDIVIISGEPGGNCSSCGSSCLKFPRGFGCTRKKWEIRKGKFSVRERKKMQEERFSD
jgi:hypothetical protein